MHVGTPEADTWLLTEAEAAVLVDGYNVAKLGWPDQVLADQRERLLDVLDDLACRHSTPVEVVFDGADVGPGALGRRRRRVAVRFSPPAVLADDVIRELVAQPSGDGPIVVVTNDRAVVHDVRGRGRQRRDVRRPARRRSPLAQPPPSPPPAARRPGRGSPAAAPLRPARREVHPQ